MMSFGLSQETIRTFFTPGPGDGYGLGPDVLSAYCGITGGSMNRGSGQNALSFPGGNDGIVRHLVKTLIPDAIQGPHLLLAISGKSTFGPTLRSDRRSNSRLEDKGATVAVEEKVKRIIVEQLGVQESQVKPEAKLADDLGLGADSLDAVGLVMALEEEFNLQILDTEAEQVQTVQDAIQYIKGRTHA